MTKQLPCATWPLMRSRPPRTQNSVSCRLRQAGQSVPGASEPLEPDPVIELYKKDVDLTLLRQNLKLTVEQRFLKLMQLQRFAAELRSAGRKAQKQA